MRIDAAWFCVFSFCVFSNCLLLGCWLCYQRAATYVIIITMHDRWCSKNCLIFCQFWRLDRLIQEPVVITGLCLCSGSRLCRRLLTHHANQLLSMCLRRGSDHLVELVCNWVVLFVQ